jgi:hypothetical protein
VVSGLDDEYGDDDFSPADWHYGSEDAVRYPPLHYNWVTHAWECGCYTYKFKGSCRHAFRLRREEIVEVDEEYL